MLIEYQMQAGTYTEFITVFANVFLGMQLALSSYLQVCFSITNDVVMSISLMYEQPESGASWSIRLYRNFKLTSPLPHQRSDGSQAPQCTHRKTYGLAVLHPDISGEFG
jgi:hypothetical protein